MTFDPYANQGDTSAWDPEAAAATKRAADKIFTEESEAANEAGADTSAGDASTGDTTEADNPSGEGSGTNVKQDPHAPENVPDPDITPDP